MQHKTTSLAWSVGVFVSLFIATSYGDAATPDCSVPREKLAAACQKAATDFRPLTKDDVAQVKVALLEAIGRLGERLARWGSIGDDWRKYLLWEKLNAELQSEQPDKATLTKIYYRYAANYDGLELAWFLDVQQALRNYIALQNAVDNATVRAAYEKRMNRLAIALGKHLAKPTTETALEISEILHWLQESRQQPALVAAIERQVVLPNVYAKVSADFVAIGLADKVDDITEVEDNIMGTDLHGKAHTQGAIHAVLAPNSDAAAIDVLFSGSAKSENIGYHGPVTIWSNSTTTLSATKRLWIRPDGLDADPAVSQAETSSTITDLQANNGCRLIERAGWKRGGRQLPQAEQIASCHAQDKLNARIDAQADGTLEKTNQQINKFRQPLADRKLLPGKLDVATTKEALTVVGLQAGGGKAAASTLPPEPKTTGDVVLQLHESAINNLAFDALAGRTIHEEKMQAMAVEMFGRLPDKMRGDDDGKPWAITFAARQPVSVTFADGGFTVTLRGAKYFKGGESYPAMDITASYKIEKTAQGYKAIRQGDISVFPPDFKRGKQQLDAHRQVIRTLLQKRFAKVFEKEILGEGIVLSGKWKAAGKITAREIICRDGWLVIVWQRANEVKTLAAK
jgi:hypothetical protein